MSEPVTRRTSVIESYGKSIAACALRIDSSSGPDMKQKVFPSSRLTCATCAKTPNSRPASSRASKFAKNCSGVSSTGGNVPVILPTEVVASTNERWVKGSDLAYVGQKLSDLTGVQGGPDIMFTPRLQSDRQGVEWVMRIGVPTEPRLFSPQRSKFYIGNQRSSVSRLRVQGDGTSLASQAFGSGGRTADQSLISVSADPSLTNAGYPLLESVDSSHSDVSDPVTLQSYSDEELLQGKRPSKVWSFTHDLSQRPFLSSFNAGDFANVRVLDDSYLEAKTHSMRILARSGDDKGTKVDLTFYPEVV